MPELRRNRTGVDLCVFCDDSGWVYVKKTIGTTYEDATACGWCERGHAHHVRWPSLKWNYEPEEIMFTGHVRTASARMTVEERRALAKMLHGAARQMRFDGSTT